MNHAHARLALAGLALASGGASLAAIAPAVTQWNAQSRELQEAATRAQTCNVVNLPIGASTAVVLGGTNAAPAEGLTVCDWMGMTAKISPEGRAIDLKQGQKEQITEILKQRGFTP